MAITSLCSGCGKTLAVADQYAGRQARCPQCGTIYTVPMTSTVTAPDPNPFASLSEPAFESQLPPPGSLSATTHPPEQFSSGATTGKTSDDSPIDLGAPINPGAPININVADDGRSPTGDFGTATSESAPQQFWMRAANGAEYGPADRTTLTRWFVEGRVGQNYMIRQGEYGNWEPAYNFQPPRDAQSANPYSNAPAPRSQTLGATYSKPDQSGLVLAMGILTWIGFCPVFGIVAWVIGSQALVDMQQGTADPTTRGLVQVGYYLGMANVVVWLCCFGFMFLSMIF